LLLACAFSVTIAAVLGSAGISDWRVKSITAAGAAVATLAGGVLQSRLTRALDQQDQGNKALTGSIYTSGRKPPLVRDIADPAAIGVHAAPRTSGNSRQIVPYVRRDVDSELRAALTGPGFVLLSGDAAAGKTRTAYEAMRAALPGHVFIAPKGIDDAAAAMAAAAMEGDCVLWLDSLQRYLGARAATSASIAEMLAGRNHHRVVLATLRAAEESRLIAIAGSLSGGQLTRDGQAVLDLVDHRIVVKRMFSGPERARAAVLADDDPRLAHALRHADRYGVAEYLSSGPQLHTEWNNAWERGAQPRGAALIAAAVDCRLAGFAAPLPRALLQELHQEYLDGRGGTMLRPEPSASAWKWATALRDSGNSPIWLSGQESCDVFDYLVDQQAREPGQTVPESTVHAALRFASPADAMAIGATAWHQDRRELAVAGFRRAYTELLRTDGPDAQTTLESRSDLAVTLHALGKLPDAEAEYRAIYDRRRMTLGSEHTDTLSSRNNLAVVLHDQRRYGEAEAEYTTVLRIRTRTLGGEHPSTLLTRNNLGIVLMDLGRLREAEGELEEVLRLRTRVLGPDHPHTLISRENLDTVRRKRSAR
jgi:tetratricopeptide (TPR) repeat protein